MLNSPSLPVTVISDFSVLELPRVVRIEPSSLCNLKCVHCPTGKRKPIGGIMPYEIFLKIIEEIRSYKERVKVVVLYHGGEPFLNKDIFKMIKAVKSIGVPFVKTVTNGMLIDNEILHRIIGSGLDSIEFSLDGSSPEENNRIRKGSDYFKIAAVIKKLLCMKKKAGSGTPDVYISSVRVPSKRDIIERREASPPEYILKDFSDFENEIKFKNTYMIRWPGVAHGAGYELIDSPVRGYSESLNYCDNLMQMVTIKWNGDVVQCCYDILGSRVMGNIQRERLADIWNCRKFKELRRSIYMRDYMKLCAACRVVRPYLFVVDKKRKNRLDKI